MYCKLVSDFCLGVVSLLEICVGKMHEGQDYCQESL